MLRDKALKGRNFLSGKQLLLECRGAGAKRGICVGKSEWRIVLFPAALALGASQGEALPTPGIQHPGHSLNERSFRVL